MQAKHLGTTFSHTMLEFSGNTVIVCINRKIFCLGIAHHENLYPNGFPEASGAGRPPQYDLNDRIFPPDLWTSSMVLIASELN
jgi:hypothetical protein